MASVTCEFDLWSQSIGDSSVSVRKLYVGCQQVTKDGKPLPVKMYSEDVLAFDLIDELVQFCVTSNDSFVDALILLIEEHNASALVAGQRTIELVLVDLDQQKWDRSALMNLYSRCIYTFHW